MSALADLPTDLHSDLHGLISEARKRTVAAVNTELTRLYWHIGKKLRDQVLQGERAAYGGRIIISFGTSLSAEFGRGFRPRISAVWPNSQRRFPIPRLSHQ